MPDALTTITKLINSPPGQLAAGAVLAGIVWKFFERVEAVLTDQTKMEIAVWLVGVKTGHVIQEWQSTFSIMFYRIFGRRTISWRSVSSSVLATGAALLIMNLLVRTSFLNVGQSLVIFVVQMAANT